MSNFENNKLNGNILSSDKEFISSAKSSYFAEIGKQELLSKDEEIELMHRIKDGDIKAYKQMISKNLRLVVQIAVKYNSSEFGLMDRISEGNLGLIHAIEKFDISKGYRFSTYAHWWIKQSIERAIMNQGRSIRLPVHVVRLLSKYNKSCKTTNSQTTGIEQIAKELNCDTDQLHQVLSNCENVVHLDQKHHDSDSNLFETVSDDSILDGCQELLGHDFENSVLEILHKMPPYEHFIVVRRIGLIGNERNTLKEVSELTGFTREQVRAREQKGLLKFRQLFKN